ncbi:Alpha-ketoglutaric semialdehyde dehydrogenase [Paraburkholderia piptadeniae]|uniref:Aldehyde dehydrogenase family protein n=2 Tax=Paraburkholderia TaxID=1822464 RepID=A0A7X1NEB6_9BURK|nr:MULTISPECIES: aldehyde dehydrogenase family protein [Paraburkholderia]MPW20418.1 aldehyde dehydrogenase family protein [Paraburkholderia franconis]SIT50949.1 Alpha-ketoglutaric semialdehyde dehydrogenase [Paraburkholderia piptadeniae]
MAATNLDAHLFINGRWEEGRSGSQPNIDPGTGEKVGVVTLADSTQAQSALDAAHHAFPAWSSMTGQARGAILKKASALLAERIEEITLGLLLESGKTKADATGEIRRTIETLAWNGEEASRISGKVHQGIVEGSTRLSLPTPLGVVVAITPWNFPAVLVGRKLGAALAAGCTVVLKASEFTPYSARAIVQTLVDAGLPDGVVNLLFGDPAALSKQLLASPVVKAVSFTGSTHVGKQLAALAAPNLIRPIFELGGHAPVIVWSDADVEKVVQVTAPAKFGSAGQSCVAPTRYLAHHSVHDALVEALAAKATSYKLGHGELDAATLGPVAHGGRVASFLSLVDDAVSKGAVIKTGGKKVERPGFFVEPTVLSSVSRDAEILTEEPFGPVATVQSVETVDEAIELANATPYAFAAYVFTDSIRVRDDLVRRLNASNIGVNQTAPSLPDVALGGLGNSGYGYEGGTEGVLAYMHLRLVSQSAG